VERVQRARQLELHDGEGEAGMTLEDAGEDQIAHRQRRIERLRRTAAGVTQYLVADPRGGRVPRLDGGACATLGAAINVAGS
jgi:hypothetical protein